MIVILSFVVFVAACFLVNEYPYGPICLYLICLPAFLLTLYWSVLHYCMEPRDFTGALAIPLAIVSMIGIAVVFFTITYTLLMRVNLRDAKETVGYVE